MAQTPSSIRMNLKPSSSPYYNYTRSPSTRSPVKISGRYDIPGGLTLALKQAIGTTTESANALDSFPAARSFAFTAGAAAVIATLGDDDELVTQRFYRARPTATPLNHYASPYVPSTPTAGLGDGRTVSPFGSPAPDWADSPSNRTWTARERVKAATCVSYSLCGKYLAVGETGYKPRVLIFSTSKDAPSDIPLTCMSDHTFGVKCMAFSSDSQYLATLGAANDGFLYVWSINSKNGSATLFASNKCTSNINTIAWIGSRLVTVGTRHVKVWRVDDPQTTLSGSSQTGNMTHKMLPGRNCVLGPLLDANFMCIGEIAPGKAIVCSERGEVCLLDDSTGNQLFRKIADAGLNVASMTADSGRLYIAGDQGRVKTLAISSLLATSSSSPSPIPFEESLMVAVACESTSINAIACLSNRLVTVDSRHAIRISHLDSSEEVGDTLHRLPAHSEAVLGVHALAMPNVKNAAFLTWSADGTVLFWDQNGICKHEMQVNLQSSEVNEDMANELRVVRAYSGAEAIVCGDKHGSLWIFETAESSTTHSVSTLPAHHGEITDVAVYESDEITYLASSGRDRTVQVFWRTDGRWELLQTLDEHIGAVTKVLFANNGQRLFSSSSDRTVVVRGRASREEEGIVLNAFLIQRTITLKATPTSITLDCDQEDILLVATIDRHIHRYDCRTGLVINNFRSADSEGGDAVALASIKKTRGMPIIVGVSSTDKSIRLYDESGTLLSRDWGHTEGITDVALIKGLGDTEEQGQRQLVTVAIDGTIFIWNLTIRASGRHDLTRSMDLMGMESISKDVLSSRPPLRKVLSQSELARFQNSNEEVFTPSPRIRKKMSKLSLAQIPKLEPSPLPSRKARNRSPSPPSPRSKDQAKSRRPSIDIRGRTKSSGNVLGTQTGSSGATASSEFGSIGASTEQLCRTLRTFRKRLANSQDQLSGELAQEVERELGLTARAVGEKAVRAKNMDEAAMARLLDQFSERLVTMLDEKIAATVAREVRHNSESGGEKVMADVSAAIATLGILDEQPSIGGGVVETGELDKSLPSSP